LRNKIDLSRPPDALFLNPWRDPGVLFLSAPEFLWRPRPGGTILGFAASDHAEMNDRISAHVARSKRHRMFKKALEYASLPVLLSSAAYHKSNVMTGDRILLSGAAGARFLNRFGRREDGAEVGREDLLIDYFAHCQKTNEGRGLPVAEGPVDLNVDVAIACRNTFDYFHFITESLAQLAMLDGVPFTGDVYFHFPNSEEKTRPFAATFVEALFPEYRGRIHFERAPKDYDRVLTVFDLIGGHFQAPDVRAARLDALAPSDLIWQGRRGSLQAQAMLAMNSVNSSLLALRERALRLIEGQDFSYLPKRFFVGRDTRQSQAPQMVGEDVLVEHLTLFGFEYVVFERLSPLEQIALMAQAEVMVSYHGAGFTNMLFANPDAYVIEIGTLQTATMRWPDFWPLAHASGCKYVSYFADDNTEAPLTDPNFATDTIVPAALSERGIGQVMAFVVSVLGHVLTLHRKDELSSLARELYQAGAVSQALALLEAHGAFVERDAALCLLKADCHLQQDAPKLELAALDLAYKVDRSRWQTLIRMIWCANRCERPQVIRWALTRLKIDFPDRHDAFVENHDWVRLIA
jgi:hypothetical protein